MPQSHANFREPWIEKDKRHGTYRVRWYTWTGTAWRKDKGLFCGADKELAKQEKERIRERLKRQHLGEADLSRSAQAAFDAFIADRRLNGYPEVTIRTYLTSLKTFLKRVRTMDDVARPETIKEWKNFMLSADAHQMAGKGSYGMLLKPNTVRRRLMDLRVWLGWCVATGWLKTNPWAEINPPNQGKRQGFLPRHRPMPRFYTDEELNAIEKAIDKIFWKDADYAEQEVKDLGELRCIWRMIYLAGMREGEAVKCRAEDVKRLENGEGVVMVRSIKGGEPVTRSVPLPAEVMECLPDVSGHLFPSWVLADGSPNYPKLRHQWNKIIRRAKIAREKEAARPTIYSGRHTFARIYLESGGDLRDLQKILGHESLDMMEVYAHFRDAYLQDRVRLSSGRIRGRITLSVVKPGQSGAQAVTSDEATGSSKVLKKSAGI
jgi:integrase/recombinase XerD